MTKHTLWDSVSRKICDNVTSLDLASASTGAISGGILLCCLSICCNQRASADRIALLILGIYLMVVGLGGAFVAGQFDDCSQKPYSVSLS